MPPAQVVTMSSVLPGFRATCLTVGTLYLLLALLNLAQGPSAILAGFGLPEAIVDSALFRDFFHWLFVHMLTIGLLLGLIGWGVREGRQQRLAARLICALELHYLYLDVRTSVWGSGLYNHPKSLVPVTVDVLVVLAFVVLSWRPLRQSAG